MKKLLLSCAMMGLLTACTSNGPLFHSWEEYETERSNAAVYKVEEPYEVKGVWYFPAEQVSYSEKGLASWYMPVGDSALTANGEVYDANLLTARHKTLPLPSLVKITNLENGKEIVARVNDRGPMVNNRLIDVSQEAARQLGMPSSGTVLVQVDLLADESRALRDKLIDEGRVYQTTKTAVKETLLEETPAVVAEAPLYKEVEEVVAGETVVLTGPKVRLGAFGDPNNARRLKNKIGESMPVQTKTITKNGRTLTLVEAGPFSTTTEAQRALMTLKAKGYNDAFIIK